MSGLSATGFERKRLVDIKSDIEDALKLAFGDNIDLSPQSGFGQQVGIFAEMISNQWESQENIYNSQSPSTAQGTQLSNAVEFNGLTRNPEAFSVVEGVVITGIASTPIPAGSQVSVVLTGFVFQTDSAVVIGGGGTVTVDMTAMIAGPIEAAIATLTEIETPVYGWTSVSNPAAATVGENEETDAELRIRREASVLASGQNLVDSLYGQLLDLDAVTDVVVLDNKTDAVDANGIPARNFLSVVQGGDDDEIAQVVWNNTPQGIQSYGSTTVQVEDAQGFDQDVSFSRPSEIDIYFDITLTVDGDYPVDGDDQVAAAVVAYGEENFLISDDVIYSQFFTPINSIPGILTVVMTMGITPAPSGTSNITIAIDEISVYDVADVGVTS
ncbi:MAG: hypothetical protein GY861_24390 [bacterium]|nr:hypothetical protein [bacterium]